VRVEMASVLVGERMVLGRAVIVRREAAPCGRRSWIRATASEMESEGSTGMARVFGRPRPGKVDTRRFSRRGIMSSWRLW
jgi:hypothetical protein